MTTAVIRDPVHGDVELTREELEILDTPAMQRLRHIKQLGTAYLVYPGCTHTRFDHSLGTLWTASRIIASLRSNGWRIDRDDERLVRIAALVHDVPHIPFGHTFEDERKVFPRHDSPERFDRFLAAEEIGERLARAGLLDEVRRILTDPSDWRGQAVSGTIDADLLDYLRRDSYFAGLAQQYDDRIFRYFCIESGELAVDLTNKGLERFDARSEIVHLLRMRYFLTERVYFHHAKVISGAMISKALELATGLGVGQEDLFDKGDETLIAFLAEVGREAGLEGNEAGRAIERLIAGVRTRRLLKRAYVLTYDAVTPHEQTRLVQTYHHSPAARQALENEIAQRAGVAPHDVIVYAPPKTALKEAAVTARLPDGVRRLNEGEGSHLELDALEEQYARIWRFWVFGPAGREQAVGVAAEEALGLPNGLTRQIKAPAGSA